MKVAIGVRSSNTTPSGLDQRENKLVSGSEEGLEDTQGFSPPQGKGCS